MLDSASLEELASLEVTKKFDRKLNVFLFLSNFCSFQFLIKVDDRVLFLLFPEGNLVFLSALLKPWEMAAMHSRQCVQEQKE